MSTFKNKNSLRTIEAQIVQKLKNSEARPQFTGSYKKEKRVSTVIYSIFNSNDQVPVLEPHLKRKYRSEMFKKRKLKNSLFFEFAIFVVALSNIFAKGTTFYFTMLFILQFDFP